MDLRYGSADENVRKRSILDIVLHERQQFESWPGKEKKKNLTDEKELFAGSGFAEEASLLCPSRAGELAVISSVNRLAAEGIRTQVFSPVILLPPGTQEELLRELMRQICRSAFADSVEIGEVHAEVTNAVTRPIVIGTAAGERFFKADPAASEAGEKDILITGPVGLEGTYILVCEHLKRLQERFPMSILSRMMKAGSELNVLKAAETAARIPDSCSAPVMVSLGEGGFFAGLWELSKKTGCGLEADLQSVPILQETIEITDFFGINPYAMRSNGSLLITASDADQVIRSLEKEGHIAVKIGKLTGKKDKIIRNGEDVRFLDRPQTDSLAVSEYGL